MLIINHNKKDYYDGVVGTIGVDKTIIYDRETIEVENEKFPKIFQKQPYYFLRSKDYPFIKLNNYSFKNEYQGKYKNYGSFIIGFCGKLYVGWKLYYTLTKSINEEVSTDITYDFEFIKLILKSKSWDGHLEDNYNYIKSYNILQLFRDLKTPVFVNDNDYGRIYLEHYSNNKVKFIINPLLKKYEFYKVFDSFQAFQEIQMFLGGVLGTGEKEIIQVADKYKIEQHGFNKWSFRKEPEKKK